MGAEAATVVPVLKGRHHAWVKRHMAIAIGFSFACVLFAKFTLNDPRKRKYAEYYK